MRWTEAPRPASCIPGLQAVNTPGSGYATRADVLNGFAQSPEFIARSDAAVNDFLFKAAQGQDVYAAHPLLGGSEHSSPYGWH